MSARGVLLIGIILATLSSGTCCDLGNITSLKLCVKESLESGSEELKPKVDPLSLQDFAGTANGSDPKWRVENASLMGLGDYSFENLTTEVTNRRDVTIRFNLTWSSVTLRAGKFRCCVKNLQQTLCFWLTGQLTISMESPAGWVEIILAVWQNKAIYQFGTFSINNLNTVSSVDFKDWIENIDRCLGLPSDIFKTEISTNYENSETAQMVTNQLLSQLQVIADDFLPSRLGRSLAAAAGSGK